MRWTIYKYSNVYVTLNIIFGVVTNIKSHTKYYGHSYKQTSQSRSRFERCVAQVDNVSLCYYKWCGSGYTKFSY